MRDIRVFLDKAGDFDSQSLERLACETARPTLRSNLPARVNKNADICSPQALS